MLTKSAGRIGPLLIVFALVLTACSSGSQSVRTVSPSAAAVSTPPRSPTVNTATPMETQGGATPLPAPSATLLECPSVRPTQTRAPSTNALDRLVDEATVGRQGLPRASDAYVQVQGWFLSERGPEGIGIATYRRTSGDPVDLYVDVHSSPEAAAAEVRVWIQRNYRVGITERRIPSSNPTREFSALGGSEGRVWAIAFSCGNYRFAAVGSRSGSLLESRLAAEAFAMAYGQRLRAP